MKKIVLKVVKQCVATDGVETVREGRHPAGFSGTSGCAGWLDRYNYKQVVETTVEIANKVGRRLSTLSGRLKASHTGGW